MDPTILQRIIDGFSQALDPGLGRMRPFLACWMSFLVLLEAVRVYGALLDDGRRGQHVGMFVGRTLILGVVYWGWPTILTTFVADCVNAGLRFMGSDLTVKQVLDPGSLMRIGLETAGPLKDILWANLGLTTPVQAFAFLICWVLYLVAYGIMSANVLLVQIELLIVTPVSMLALGFLFCGPTRQMAGGVLSYGLNMGLCFFAQAMLSTILLRLTPLLFPPLPRSTAFPVAIEQAVIMVMAAMILAYLFWKIPGVISHHLAGTPTLGAGSFLQMTTGLVGMATGATMLLRSGGTAWQVRPPPRQITQGGGGPPQGVAHPAPPRLSPPPMPALQALNSTLRAGSQYLGHSQQGGGLHVQP